MVKLEYIEELSAGKLENHKEPMYGHPQTNIELECSIHAEFNIYFY